MHYDIVISEKASRVGLERSPTSAVQDQAPQSKEESYSVDVEGDRRVLSVLKREPDQIILSFDGRVFAVRQFERTEFSVTFLVNNQLVVADIKGSVTSSFNREVTAGSGVASVNENVIANFPAKVVKVGVNKGDHLKESDTIMVLEAMKMESQIRTPRACTVSEVFVKEGALVERGKVLAKLVFD
jgi:biotin carboxyl carrier protein